MKVRTKELRMVKASELRRNPRNWRLHPDEQKAALEAILGDVGFVGAVIARETPDGLELLDGHMRADVSDNTEIPVAIVDLDDDEAAKILATYDPLSEMAKIDTEKLGELLGAIEIDENAEIRRMLADLHGQLVKDETARDAPENEREVLGMALQPHEHYDYLVVLASTSHEWNVLCDRLKLQPMQRRGGMGTSRAIRATELLMVLDNARLHDSGPKQTTAAQHADPEKLAADSGDLRGRKGRG